MVANASNSAAPMSTTFILLTVRNTNITEHGVTLVETISECIGTDNYSDS